MGVLFLIAIVVMLYFYFFSTPQESVPVDATYLDNQASISQRVENLLSYMSLEEKIGQMALVEERSIHDTEDVGTYGLGGVLSGFGAHPENNTREGWQEMVRRVEDPSRTSRLGIPILYGVDAIHGHSNVLGATVFPHAIGLGASGDASLVRDIGVATASELLATGIRWNYTPTYDMPEDIRWGRVFESFSDDPVLVSELGGAYIDGLQTGLSGSDERIDVLATAKHYIGAGAMEWESSSNDNFYIDQGTTPMNEEKLREVYLPPFQKAVEEGVGSVMVGLNSWGDTKLAGSEYLIQDVLKDELGFEGFVVSDWYGVYEIPGGDYRAAVTAINAGVDMVMLPFDYKTFIENIEQAVGRGDIREERIDDAVRRILRVKFELGLFDESRLREDTQKESFGGQEHRTLARRAVAESLVLLKNDKNILPLIQEGLRIRVAGSAADNVGRQAGGWTVEWQGIDGNWIPGATSILDGMREVAPVGTVIEFDEKAEFPRGIKADVGIAIVGEEPYAEGVGDNPRPVLSDEDIDVIDKLEAEGNAVVVVLVTGRPLFITEEIGGWDALVVAWLPGSEGAGVADVLLGQRPFSGTLPLPWPAQLLQLPIATDGTTSDDTKVLFPRYFGL